MQSAMKGSPIVDPSQPQKPEQTAAQKNPLENEPPSFTAVERKPGQLTRSLELACRCAKTADELKGGDIKVLDLTNITAEFDYFVIATGNSRRQLHAIVEEIDTEMAAAGSKRIGVEGYDSNQWILQDYGDIVLHVFDTESRELYDLERLWGDAEEVDWKAVLEKSGS
ncbi:MAG: ribosome silencing factor [Rubinisphaera brasiliensis]|uniref:Ribosomal silencing factor RsfS n=1 Tax=Rubinisphaera brasiliensis (strain ATCC 49424 / DSM 5305 / JCM 21570 / IAM 15109 / NBRC 103401 / IFAM 1448) TaxID=756272 RepID=F0SS65_RUBBR|nr:ribosome silencing factor [Rubinisphaera brasiliensis]ADY58076.1 iojap-like protein [Rubinisphaera brasiliensis DSM 5305]